MVRERTSSRSAAASWCLLRLLFFPVIYVQVALSFFVNIHIGSPSCTIAPLWPPLEATYRLTLKA